MINYALTLLQLQKRIEAAGGNLLHPHCRKLTKRQILCDMAYRIGNSTKTK